MNRTGDHFTLRNTLPFPEPGTADLETVRRTFVHTVETTEVCTRLLHKLAAFPSAQPRPTLLVGRNGTGKTHLLRYVQAMVADPGSPEWGDLEVRARRRLRPDRPLGTLLVDIPVAQDAQPEPVILRALGASSDAEPGTQKEAAALQHAASQLAGAGVALVVIDGLGRRADALAATGTVPLGSSFWGRVVEAFCQAGILLAVTGDDRHLRGSGAHPPALSAVAARCDVLWLSHDTIAEVFASTIAVKSGTQREELLTVLARLQAALPELAVNPDIAVALYPIHRPLFEMLFRVRSRLPEFSPLSFMQSAAESWRDRPEEQLITLVDLFDRLSSRLRKDVRFSSLLASADETVQKTRTMFRGQLQIKCDSLIKGLAIDSLFESEPRSLRDLVNAVLVYDESGTIPGYGLADAMMDRVAEETGRWVAFEGEGMNRRCRLIPWSGPARDSAIAEDASPARGVVSREKAGRAAPSQRASSPAEEEIQTSLRWSRRVFEEGKERINRAAAVIAALPEPFMTHSVWKQLRGFASRAQETAGIKSLLDGGAIGPHEAGARLAAVFGGDEAQLDRWLADAQRIAEAGDWMPQFEQMRAWVLASCLTGDRQVDALRTALCERIDKPELLLGPAERESFVQACARFKELYTECYLSLHKTCCELSAPASGSPVVDATGLRNIELLARLPGLNPVPLYRVRVLGQRLQRSLCRLSVQDALRESPRCYCGFNPGDPRRSGDAITELNAAIKEGMDEFRAVIRTGGNLIIRELRNSGVSQADSQSIAALLSHGAAVPLTPVALEILKTLITTNPAAFGIATARR
jgi:hypothetical protein